MMKAKQILRTLAALVVAGGLLAASTRLNTNAQAQGGPQGRRNFDPAQFQQMMMDRLREQFEVKNDDEWKIIQDRLQKVMDARLAGMAFSGGMGMPGMGRPPGGGPGRGFMGGAPSPEAEALQQAVEAKAPAQELKDKLTKFREARKANEAKLEAAQEELRQVLSVKQEAIAALSGLVK